MQVLHISDTTTGLFLAHDKCHLVSLLPVFCKDYFPNISLSVSSPSSPSKHQIQAVCFQFYSPSPSDFTIPIILHKVEKKSAINLLLFDFQISPIVLSPVLSVMTVKYLIILLQVSHSGFSSLCIESLDTYIAWLSWQVFPISLSLSSLVLHRTIISLSVCAMLTAWSWSASWEPLCTCTDSQGAFVHLQWFPCYCCCRCFQVFHHLCDLP